MYAAMLSALDDGVGQVVRTLRELRLFDNTLLIFTGDNGATREARAGLGGKPATAGNNQPFRGNKFSVFDGGMHVPMVMHWPGTVARGKVSDEVGSHLDLLPTIAAAAGAALPRDRTLDGNDALAASYRGHDAIFWSIGGQLAVRRGEVETGEGRQNPRRHARGQSAIDRRRRPLPLQSGGRPRRKRQPAPQTPAGDR